MRTANKKKMKIVSSILLVCSLIIIGATQKLQAQCTTGYSQIIVNIIPDNYPGETSWDIKDASNSIIASGTTNNDTLCSFTGKCLHFTIYDSYGDGICCAYGNGSYNVYINGNLIASGGQFTFNETTFFNYPPGYVSTTLINAFQQLMDHCNNITLLSPAQINSLADSIHKYHFYLAETLPVISSAFDVINCYETNTGPVFLNTHTTGGFPNAPGALDGFEYDRVIYLIQQELFEVLYTKDKIAEYSTFLQGRKYLTSNYFPGVCPLPVDSAQVYIATVNASMPANWGKPTAWALTPARRPTGYYLSPGSIGKVKVPDIMVNAGYKILVGAHPLMNSSITPIQRFFRIFNTYEITDSVTLIANPFGGGIYITTPYQASAGLQPIELTNVVPAPFFSAKSYDMTTLSQWQNVQRLNPAPWADFESEKFMMQVPTSFIYNYSDPVTLMADWDARMDVVSNLLGYPLVRNNQILYVMLDVHILHPGYYGIGNPQINNPYSPYTVQNGNSQMWFLVPGAAHLWETEFHELGHAQSMEKFPGEAEAIVNLLSAAIFNELYGIDIDSAFGWSFNNEYWRSRDQSAINWMVTHNFRTGNPMDISNTTKDEVRYQHRGYGKYVEIAALFGWEALESYYHQVNLDYINGVPPGPLGQVDDRILKLSLAAGVDLRPLIHFWGVHPQDSAALALAIISNNLQPSPLICNRLMHYQSIIPMDSAQFSQHAQVYFNGPVPPGGDPDYENGWYNVWLPLYNNLHGDSAVAALQHIIDSYFPDGCDIVTPPGIPENIAVGGEIGGGLTPCYNASNTITIGGSGNPFTLLSGSGATFIAWQKISFMPGTHIQSGSNLHGYISPGAYCVAPFIPVTAPGTGEKTSKNAGPDLASFSIYPNPANGNFFLVQKGEKLIGNVKVEVFTVRGDRVMTESMIVEKQHEFKSSDLKTGLYFVKVVADGYVETMKLVIRR